MFSFRADIYQSIGAVDDSDSSWVGLKPLNEIVHEFVNHFQTGRAILENGIVDYFCVEFRAIDFDFGAQVEDTISLQKQLVEESVGKKSELEERKKTKLNGS